MKNNRLQVKRLIVLGAGASYGATLQGNRAKKHKVAPLDKDFCERIAGLDIQRPLWVADAKKSVVKKWEDPRAFESYGLEQAIMRQVTHINFLNDIYQRPGPKPLSVSEYLNNLTHLIGYVLSKSAENEKQYYKKLIGNLFPEMRNPETYKNRIISFNYDDLPERHLFERVKPQQVYFDRLQDEKSFVEGDRKRKRKARYQNPLVLKMHGSLNWRCESQELAKIVDGVTTHKVGDKGYWIENIWYSDSHTTPSIEDEDAPCIIPPLPNKPVADISLFRTIWRKAAEYLSEADELVICGYSLPETDQLAVSLFSNFQNMNLKRIRIVDPDPTSIAKWRQLLRRKGIDKPEWIYHENLEEYADKLKVPPRRRLRKRRVPKRN